MIDHATESFTGFAAKEILSCSVYDRILFGYYFLKRTGEPVANQVPFEVNVFATLAFRGIGYGYSAMEDWYNDHCTL